MIGVIQQNQIENEEENFFILNFEFEYLLRTRTINYGSQGNIFNPYTPILVRDSISFEFK